MKDQEPKSFRRFKLLLDILLTLGFLITLGSCVRDIDSIGGGFDANQRAVQTFFFYLLIVLPCLAALYIYLSLKLEKHYLSQEVRNKQDEAFKKYSKSELKRILGPAYTILEMLFKPKNKK